MKNKNITIARDPLWYKDAVLYETHVRAFCDSDGDGVGDFRGLASKLDYIQELGVTAIWLLPFYPSPLRDDGYDISDYMDIHPSYGTLSDFKFFLKEAHERGIQVITELVLNHTSDQHPWFRRAKLASKGSKERDFYVWNDKPNKYKEVRIIFKDYETSNWTLDETSQSYYWHRFFSHQPDLNFDNPAVRKAVLGVLEYWFEMGVDGFRLDAVPYLFEREGTSCENLPETHRYLQDLRSHIDKKFEGRMLLAEANQWPEDAVHYFGKGDECHMAFHFPIMPRLFMSLHMEDRFPIIDILNQTPAIPGDCQWAIFLRNHDELTLEMVTDEERDYMYRAYANNPQARINLGIRRRLAPLLGNNRKKIELMNGLLFSLPGTPVIYYGDELGMGDNIYLGDRNGVRTPMQWSADKNAGFSKTNPQQLFLPINTDPEYHYETVNVEAQQNNPHSLLWWTKRLIALRKRFKAFSRGTIEFLSPENRKVLVFVRKFEEETLLVVANLSRFVQYVEIDLSAYKGMVPVEMFGHTEFPPIGDLPYLITPSPHSFFWFKLETAKEVCEGGSGQPAAKVEELHVSEKWQQVLEGKGLSQLLKVLPQYIQARRWYGGKARRLKNVSLYETIALPDAGENGAVITVVKIDYTEGESEFYVLPMTWITGEASDHLVRDTPQFVIAPLEIKTKAGALKGVLADAVGSKAFLKKFAELFLRAKSYPCKSGELKGGSSKSAKSLWTKKLNDLEPSIARGEQSNSSVFFADQFVLKIFRRFEDGVNPDLEIGRFLSEKTAFHNSPAVAGAVELCRGRQEPATLAVAQHFVQSQGDAWSYTLDEVCAYFERVLSRSADAAAPSLASSSPLTLAGMDVDPLASEMINPYLEIARLLGKRTGELHLALSQRTENPAFDPEPFTPFYQRSVYQSMRNLTNSVFLSLNRQFKTLPEAIHPEVEKILASQSKVLKQFEQIRTRPVTAQRTRYHGDFHLGQILYTGNDFVIIDFEGEPARTLQERKIKRSPLRDVAGLIRSFHYAVYTSLHGSFLHQSARPEDVTRLEPWAHFWYSWTSSAFLRAYMDTVRSGAFLPEDSEDLQILLSTYLLEKSLYELNYELNNRPDWVSIPVKGVLHLLDSAILNP